MTACETADRILFSTAVFTANTLEPFGGGVALKDERILAVGTRDDLEPFIGEDTAVEDFGDKLIMPGFNDSHMHFALASAQHDEDFCVIVEGLPSEQACLERIRAFADAHPDNPWVYGWGWDAAMWDDHREPTRFELDEISKDRPICISHFTMHTSWCNSKALELAGITKDTPDPEGGTIVRDKDGNPTGVLYEHPASCLVADMALDVPNLESSIEKCLARFANLGITAIGDMFPRDITNDNVYETYKSLEDQNRLTCRISFFPSLLDVPAAVRMRGEYCSDRLRIGGVKQIMDGIVEAQTAFMLEPYEGSADHCGETILPPEEFERLVALADGNGLPVRVHCIGDATARLALDAYAAVEAKNGNKGLRHCIEHAETVRDEDMERMRDLGVCASVQPLHAIYGTVTGFYDEAIGEERAGACWRFRNLLDAGVRVGISTDFPAAASVEPMQVVCAAVTRRMPDGYPEGGFHPEYALTLGETLQCMTQGSAYVESFDRRIGTLERGKLADIIVVDRNLFALDDPMDILKANVDLTIVGGQDVFRRN